MFYNFRGDKIFSRKNFAKLKTRIHYAPLRIKNKKCGSL